jgi:hypothetical protein
MLERHKRPLLVLRIGNLGQHLVDELGDSRELVLARPGFIVDAHTQLELVGTEVRVVRRGAGDVAVVEADTDRAEARVDVESE